MLNFSFSKKSKRSEFWAVYLTWLLIGVSAFVLSILSVSVSMHRLTNLSSLVNALGFWSFLIIGIAIVATIDCLAVTVRRCNDIGISPFWALTTFVPYLQLAAILILGLLDSKNGVDGRSKPVECIEKEAGVSASAKTVSAAVDAVYSGNRQLSEDAYKIFLVNRYEIKKNAVLGQFECVGKLFDSVDAALEHAHQIEEKKLADEIKRESLIVEEQQRKIDEWVAGDKERVAKRKKFLLKLMLALTIIVFVVYGCQVLERSQLEGGVHLIKRTALGTGVSTTEYDKELKSAGWKYFRSYRAEVGGLKEYIEYKNESYPNKLIRTMKDGCNINLPSVNKKFCANRPSFYEEFVSSELIQKSVADTDYRSPPLVNAIIIDVGTKPFGKLEELQSEIAKSDIMRDQLQNYSVGSMGNFENLEGNKTDFIYIGFFPNKRTAEKYLSYFKQYGDAYLTFVDY